MPHIVDQLIEERAEALRQRPLLWRSLRPLIYPLLGYRRAIRMADTIADLSGLDTLRYLSDVLDLDVQVSGLEHVPTQGLAVVTPNHPSGIADGIAVFDALRRIREDVSFFANRDAIRVSPGMADVIVPVEWMETRRSHGRNRETVRHMVEAFRAERLIVIFPSGRLARPTMSGLVEREWQPSALNLALKYAAPVTPMHIDGRNSWLYYLFYAIHHELRDMTLFRELLNKRGSTYRIRLGEPFAPAGDPRALTTALRRFVTESLPRGQTRFEPPLADS
ncbi:MAG: acyltransferase [Gammaproteobacteria bacterium]|nr:acyltransferase [Gammaproteobacteria bacterium]